MNTRPLLLLAVLGILPGCAPPAQEADLSRFFTNAEGTFVLLDGQTGRTIRHNPERAGQRFTPASTFKIPNSLIALETGVASGPDFPLAWDPDVTPPQDWWPATWRKDHVLRTAFRNSVVWYYQELARRIGRERMQTYVQRFGYGNQDLTGGIDQFWLGGGLRISPDEQVEFLRRFHRGELGASPRTTQTVKHLMLLDANEEYQLSGKSGTMMVEGGPDRELAWFVGYVHRGDQVYFYALNMEGDSVGEDWPPDKRLELVLEILRELKILSRPASA